VKLALNFLLVERLGLRGLMLGTAGMYMATSGLLLVKMKTARLT
jgi:hypothetical protein